MVAGQKILKHIKEYKALDHRAAEDEAMGSKPLINLIGTTHGFHGLLTCGAVAVKKKSFWT